MTTAVKKFEHLSRPVLGLLLLLLIDFSARMAWWKFIDMPPLAGHTNVSFDLRSWGDLANVLLQGRNPYAVTHQLNYAPFWAECLYALNHIAAYSGFALTECIRAVLLLADLVLLVCLDWLMRELNPRHDRRVLLFGYCLNPFLIILTIQHGNFDVIAVIWIVLCLIMLIQFRRLGDPILWLCAAACLGMGIFTKTFPLILWPLLAGGIGKLNWRTRILGAVIVVAPFALSLLPMYVLATEGVTRYVLQYRSVGVEYGMVSLFRLAMGTSIVEPYGIWSTRLILATSVAIAGVLTVRPLKQDRAVVLLAAILLLMTFSVGPGYGTQYWFWVIPLFVVCYANYSGMFRWIALACGCVVICANIVEYAFRPELGEFWLCHWPTTNAEAIGRWLLDPGNVTLFRLPMTISALIFLTYSAVMLCNRKLQSPAPVDQK